MNYCVYFVCNCLKNRINKGLYFIAETKGTMDSLNLKPIEKAKIECAEKLFEQLSGAEVVYERVDSYQSLLDIMNK